ncbi:MAG: sensor histidine kinase [Anaerolineales bacterium]|nr:sensor histidine kinase [Anaerolineales bacterium]
MTERALDELSLHILDIAENSIAAGARTIEISVVEDSALDRLSICVVDDGRGVDEHKLAHLADPFVTSRTTRRAGFGIPFLKAAAQACNGDLRVSSAPGQGTCLVADFQRSHIDRMPLGDLAATVLGLVVSYPGIRWVLRYSVDGRVFDFDSEPIRQELGDIPLTEPDVLRFIRETLVEGIRGVLETAPA